MRFLLYCFFLLLIQPSFAQNSSETIDLLSIKAKPTSVDYYLKSVVFSPEVNTTIGKAEIRGKSKHVELNFPINREKYLLDFLNLNYNGDKSSTPISLYISQLGIYPTTIGQVSSSDTFRYVCEFRTILDGTEEAIYTFNAKNAIGSFENPNVIVSNYMARAITTSVKQFSSEFKNHKEWNVKNNKNVASVIVSCNHNRIKSKLDSLACEKNFKLNTDCYSINLKDDVNGLQTRYMLTYKAETEESNNKIKLNIETYAFLAKNRSWISKNEKNPAALFPQQQGHYDICYLYGIKLNKAMREYPYTMGEFKSEMNKVYNQIYNEYIKLRKEYEDDTKNHPENIQKWQQKIAAMSKEVK